MSFIHYGLSETGRVRPNNEDAWTADAKEGLYLAADGMGGHAAGEVAAHMAVVSLVELFQEKRGLFVSPDSPETRDSAAGLLETVNQKIYTAGVKHPDQRGMGSTVVLCLVRKKKALIAHVGDSRAYLYRAGQLSRLTKDHSVFQELNDRGLASENERRGHPARFQLTQCLGQGQKISPGISILTIIPGDRILLCTDGLHDMVGDNLIQNILLRHDDLQQACEALAAEANRAGGLDNITVLLIMAGKSAKRYLVPFVLTRDY